MKNVFLFSIILISLFLGYCNNIFAYEAEDYFREGTIFLKDGKWEQAVEKFNLAIKSDEKFIGAHFNLGCALALQGENMKSASEFEKVLELDDSQDIAFAYFNLGGIWIKDFFDKKEQETLEKAAEYFTRAAETLPHFQLAYDYTMHANMWIGSMRGAGGPWGGYKLTVSEIGVCPDSSIFLSTDQFLGEGEGRICAFDEDAPPLLYFYKSPSTYLLLGISDTEQKNLQKAGKNFNTALELLNNETENYFNKLATWNAYLSLARLYASEEEWDKSIAFANKAKDLNLEYSSEYITLLVAYLEKRDYLKAKEAAESLLYIKPENKPAERIASLQLSSPRLTEDDWYHVQQHGLRIKKPKNWLLLDEETNSEMLREWIGDAVGFIAIFSDGLSVGTTRIGLEFTSFSSGPISPEYFLATLIRNTEAMSINNPQMNFEEKPHFVKLNNEKFIKSTVHFSSPEGINLMSVYYYLVKGGGFYTMSVQLKKADFLLYKDLIEETAASITVTSDSAETASMEKLIKKRERLKSEKPSKKFFQEIY